MPQLIDGQRFYGCWAGNPDGHPEDPTLCIKGVWPGGRAPIERQCHRPRGFGADKAFCRQHADDGKRYEARVAADVERRMRDQRIQKTAADFSKRLGLPGCEPLFNSRHFRYEETLLVPFGVMEIILKELER